MFARVAKYGQVGVLTFGGAYEIFSGWLAV